MIKRQQHGVLKYTFGGFMVRGGDQASEEVTTRDGLTSVGSGQNLWIIGGEEDASCNLAVTEYANEPPLDPSGDWTEIVEVSVESNDHGLWLDLVGDETPGFDDALTTSGSATYRVRVYAAGRDAAYDLLEHHTFSDEPIESFRLDIWAAPCTADVVIKTSDRVGALRRARQA